jgi:hypothetical protein
VAEEGSVEPAQMLPTFNVNDSDLHYEYDSPRTTMERVWQNNSSNTNMSALTDVLGG